MQTAEHQLSSNKIKDGGSHLVAEHQLRGNQIQDGESNVVAEQQLRGKKIKDGGLLFYQRVKSAIFDLVSPKLLMVKQQQLS